MKLFAILCCMFIVATSNAQGPMTTFSPNGDLKLEVSVKNGQGFYAVTFKGKIILEDSPLGLLTNEADFTSGLSAASSVKGSIDTSYTEAKAKRSHISYKANTLKCLFTKQDKQISVMFQVSNNDIAFRYELPAWGDTKACFVEKEATGFKFPAFTKSFLSNMMSPMSGFARTAPSYESGYEVDVPIANNRAREGYVFPALFRIGENGWALLSETGVGSSYCASHLSNYQDGIYTVEYPNAKQNNGFGSSGTQLGLPGVTPWRTITVGETLAPIVETTIPFDVVNRLYEPSQDYKFGRGTWSWIVWQDNSMNYADQVKYIDMAAEMRFEYILIDAWWDERIGYDKMKDLINYAKFKNVDVFLWYNSNGSANDAFMTPLNKMNNAIVRKKEMKWLKDAGVKGLKVDFFGGDKQETMRLYEDILSDANDYGLMIIFHGATLPRGWEKMYPNFVGSEAVLASEMLIFSEDVRKKEAHYASLHPFIRNTVASMEYGGVLLNKYLNKGNKNGQERQTTNAFQLATSVLFQNPVQMFGLTPNNLSDVPAFELDFLKDVPVVWNDTKFIDGYPGDYSVIARLHDKTWYVAGVNANKSAKALKLKLPMLAGKTVVVYNDNKTRETFLEKVKIPKNGELPIAIQSNGGFVIKLID